MPYYFRQTWKRHLAGTLYAVGAWVIALLLFRFVRNFGHTDALRQSLGVAWHTDIIAHIAAGILIGLASGVVNTLLDRPRVRRLPFGVTILVKSIAFGMVFTATFTLNLLMVSVFVPAVLHTVIGSSNPVVRDSLLVAFVYAAVVNLVVDFVRQVDRKLGPGELARFIAGKYHTPREEERIFMFLDLTSSTTHAEQLGHIRYSRLLQDCFFDLTDVVTRYNAEVYQYVGDEVVLTWKLGGRYPGTDFIEARFAFRDTLTRRAEYYRSTYGFVPEFKTGAHAGRVTVAEVGEVKREIAFHGDVLNTTARITSKCTDVGATFLVSESMIPAIATNHKYRFEKIGNVDLRGKRKAVSLFSVDCPQHLFAS